MQALDVAVPALRVWAIIALYMSLCPAGLLSFSADTHLSVKTPGTVTYMYNVEFDVLLHNVSFIPDISYFIPS